MKKFVIAASVLAAAVVLAACSSSGSSGSSSVSAQASSAAPAAPKYPVHPITIIVPQAAGSASDLLARTLAQPLGKLLNQVVTVKDISGGSGIPAIAALESAPADGYTILLSSQSMEYGLAQHLTSYTTSNLTFLARLVEYPMGVYVNANSPYSTMSGLISYAKAHPGALSFTASGAVSAGEEIVAKLESDAGIKVTYVSVKGGNQAAVAVLSGQSNAGAGVLGNALSYVRAGKMRVIYLASNSSNPLFPNVPTSATLNLNDVVDNWVGVILKAGTPPSIQTALMNAVQSATSDAKWKAFVKAHGLSSDWGSTATFQAAVAAEMPQITAYVKSSKG